MPDLLHVQPDFFLIHDIMNFFIFCRLDQLHVFKSRFLRIIIYNRLLLIGIGRPQQHLENTCFAILFQILFIYNFQPPPPPNKIFIEDFMTSITM